MFFRYFFTIIKDLIDIQALINMLWVIENNEKVVVHKSTC